MSDDVWNKQYTRAAAVEDQLELDSLATHYQELYKKKHRGMMPLIADNNAHLFAFRELRRITGQKAFEILEAYFQMKDEWFEKQGYSMQCLLKNLNRVNQVAQRTTATRSLQGKIEIRVHCDSCWTQFDLTCPMTFDFLTELVRCDECKKMNRPLKLVTKEDRDAAMRGYYLKFPEMPKSDTNGDLME